MKTTKVRISKITRGRKIPYDLLYLADESHEAISFYLDRGECYCAYIGRVPVGVYVLLPTHPFTAELANVAVCEERQGEGIGRQLIAHAIKTAREQKFSKLEVGTANGGTGQLAFYQKCGFRMEWIDRDFISRNYPKPIIENGIECRDMVRMGMEL